jgi:hypothetical protein
LHIHRLAFVGKGGVPGDDEELPDARKCGDDVFSYSIRKIFLFRVTGKIAEW